MNHDGASQRPMNRLCFLSPPLCQDLSVYVCVKVSSLMFITVFFSETYCRCALQSTCFYDAMVSMCMPSVTGAKASFLHTRFSEPLLWSLCVASQWTEPLFFSSTYPEHWSYVVEQAIRFVCLPALPLLMDSRDWSCLFSHYLSSVVLG